jgi:exopolysaccharide (amylovoran) exporter
MASAVRFAIATPPLVWVIWRSRHTLLDKQIQAVSA